MSTADADGQGNKDMEIQTKTVPPRPRGRGLLGFAAGLLPGIGIFAGWKAALPRVQNEGFVAKFG